MNRYAILFFLFLTGCSTYNAQYQVPVPSNHEKEYQRRIQASRHWQIIAEDIAKESAKSLKERSLNLSSISLQQVKVPNSFTKALNSFVLSELVKQNLNVVESQNADILISHDIQVVEFNSYRKNRNEDEYYPGLFTGITAGLIILSDSVYKWSRDSVRAGQLGLAAGLDFAMMSRLADESTIKIPNIEVIVNSSITKNGRYLMRKSDIYYINDNDKSLYSDAMNYPIKSISVVNQ